MIAPESQAWAGRGERPQVAGTEHRTQRPDRVEVVMIITNVFACSQHTRLSTWTSHLSTADAVASTLETHTWKDELSKYLCRMFLPTALSLQGRKDSPHRGQEKSKRTGRFSVVFFPVPSELCLSIPESLLNKVQIAMSYPTPDRSGVTGSMLQQASICPTPMTLKSVFT